jgi:hypothetical protein
MKFFLPLPLLFLFCLSAAAQAEFAPIGARWFQNAGINNDSLIHPLQDFYVIESEKDTLVDGLVHRKVGDFLFYQDSTKVYFRWQDSLRLIYDYGVAVGDTVRFEMFEWPEEEEVFENTLVVDDISYVMAGMDSLKWIACRIVEGQGALYTQYYTYLERMGSIRTLVEDLTYAVPLNYVPEWLRCYQDDEVSYQTERFLMTAEEGENCDYRAPTSTQEPGPEIEWLVFPNPVSGGVLQVQTDYTNQYIATLYNAYGQAVQERAGQGDVQLPVAHLPAGLYRLVLRGSEDGAWLVACALIVR